MMEGNAHRMGRRVRLRAGDYVVADDNQWHPLDGVPAPEYIPEQWDGPHVGLRLIDGFKTLANLPGGIRTQGSGFWPQYFYEWEDLLAQRESGQQAIELRDSEQNRTRSRPSAREITQMELTIAWPGHYISDTVIARTVQRVAHWRSREQELDRLAHVMGMSARTLRKRNRAGLDTIATGLRRDKFEVF